MEGSRSESGRSDVDHVAKCCSFCGKSREVVRDLVASASTPGVAICDQRVALCVEFFNEQPPE